MVRHDFFRFWGVEGIGRNAFCRNSWSDEVYVCLDAVLVRQHASNECFHFCFFK